MRISKKEEAEEKVEEKVTSRADAMRGKELLSRAERAVVGSLEW